MDELEMLREENNKLKQEIQDDEEFIRLQAKYIELLKEKISKRNGGRPKKLSEEDKSMIQMYRLQGRTVKEIAELFNCSMSTINRTLSDI